MKLRLLMFTLTMLVLPSLAYSFSWSGSVNSKISYNSLKVFAKNRYSVIATGSFRNRTKHEYRIDGKIQFCDIFGSVINYGRFYETIAPYGTTNFSIDLRYNNLRDTQQALKVIWNIDDLEEFAEKSARKATKGDDEPGWSTVRDGRFEVSIEGKNDHVSDSFHLDSGISVFKFEHTGTSNFVVYLRSAKGAKKKLIVNEIGNYSKTTNYMIDRSSDYDVDVHAEGFWSITITKPEVAPIVDRDKHVESPPQASSPKTTIVLTTGARFKVDEYYDMGDSIQFEQYGALITFPKTKIAKIQE